MEYALILLVVILISPFVLRLASRQDKKTKSKSKTIFLTILILQIILGFFNWENFSIGRSGFELSLAYPNSLLGLFFIISALQILALLTSSFNTQVVTLNLINTVLIFISMVKLSNILGVQIVSLSSIGAVFLVLFGNVSGLIWINKDTDILAKYFK